MKTLKFHFCHPVKGVINFFNTVNPKLNRAYAVDTVNEQTAIVPVDDLPEGKWKALLTWEYDDREYSYQKDFMVKKRTVDVK